MQQLWSIVHHLPELTCAGCVVQCGPKFCSMNISTELQVRRCCAVTVRSHRSSRFVVSQLSLRWSMTVVVMTPQCAWWCALSG